MKKIQKLLLVVRCWLLDHFPTINPQLLTNNYFIFVAVISITSLSGCSKKETEPPINDPSAVAAVENTITFTDEQYKTVGIELGHVEDRQLSGAISVTGMLDVPPQNVVNITVDSTSLSNITFVSFASAPMGRCGSIQIFDLQANGRAARSFHHINHLRNFAVSQARRRFEKNRFAIRRTSVQRAMQPVVEFAERRRRLAIERIRTVCVDRHQQTQIASVWSLFPLGRRLLRYLRHKAAGTPWTNDHKNDEQH